MVIDLRKCIGCGACALVCSQARGIPTNLWRVVIDCGFGAFTDRQRVCLPLSCMHCGKPVCLAVCPTGATRLGQDGIVDIDPQKCLGCGYCIMACPYRARSIICRDGDIADEVDAEVNVEASTNGRAYEGVSSKCDFCLDRVRAGLAMGLEPGVVREASPLCVNACSAGALIFGDLDNPKSEPSRYLRQNGAIRLQENLGTEPAVFYIIE